MFSSFFSILFLFWIYYKKAKTNKHTNLIYIFMNYISEFSYIILYNKTKINNNIYSSNSHFHSSWIYKKYILNRVKIYFYFQRNTIVWNECYFYFFVFSFLSNWFRIDFKFIYILKLIPKQKLLFILYFFFYFNKFIYFKSYLDFLYLKKYFFCLIEVYIYKILLNLELNKNSSAN